MPDAISIQRLADVEAIRRTIAQYAQLMDDGRFDEWADLFAQDAEFWSIPGHHLPGGHEIAKIIGRETIVASISSVQNRMKEAGGVIHFGGSPIVEVEGDAARAWWDFIVIHAKPSANEVSFAGRYYANFARQGGRWRFKRRISVRPGYPVPAGIARTPAE